MANRARLVLRALVYSRQEAARGVETPVAYEVVGLPAGYSLVIGKFRNRWQLLLQTPHEMGRWTGDYASPEEALEAVQQQV